MIQAAFLYLFNPDHDLALANRDPNYMAPVMPRRLAADLALLPVWYAPEGSFVLAPSAHQAAHLDWLRTLFPCLPALLTEPEVAGKAWTLRPWGWNPAVRKRFQLLGAAEEALPGEEQMEQMRRCSNRSLAVELLKSLRLSDDFCGESHYFTNLEAVREFVESRPDSLLKAPLSGSGKGLNWCKGLFTDPIRNWCSHILKQQAGVVVEPIYNKMADFAMQFEADGSGGIAFRGYSLFQTNSSGAYEGNLLKSDRAIEKLLSTYVPLEALHRLKRELEGVFAQRISKIYTGYFGVDMMICAFPDRHRIHPCVEINLRMNMGMTAHRIYDRYVCPQATGRYRVEYYATREELMLVHRRLTADHPLQIDRGRVAHGYLPLVPVTPQSRYLAYVLID